MKALLYYAAAVGAILAQLPRVRENGKKRKTALWALLWAVALGLAAMWFWGPEMGLADLLAA